MIVRFQGEILDRRCHGVRARVPYLVYLPCVLDLKANRFDIVRREVEHRWSSAFLIVGVVFHAGAWDVIPRERAKPPTRNK